MHKEGLETENDSIKIFNLLGTSLDSIRILRLQLLDCISITTYTTN